jgi:hypothetical protein
MNAGSQFATKISNSATYNSKINHILWLVVAAVGLQQDLILWHSVLIERSKFSADIQRSKPNPECL